MFAMLCERQSVRFRTHQFRRICGSS
jgi:hypothetical protein